MTHRQGPRTAILGWLTVLLLLASVGFAVYLGAQGRHLAEPRLAPRGGVSLQMAPTAEAANRIIHYWRRTSDPARIGSTEGQSLRHTFGRQLHLDTLFIGFYTLTLLIALVWGMLAATADRDAMKPAERDLEDQVGTRILVGGVVLMTMTFGAMLCDLAENRQLALMVREGADAASVSTTRLLAQTKFVLLLPPVLGVLGLAGAAMRRRRTPAVECAGTPGRFTALAEKETREIFDQRLRGTADSPTIDPHRVDEPWISFRSSDVVGLALSGGGIRSATFSLGLMQQLDECRVLPLVDYLSTVSGGGYVGGYLSARLSDPPEDPPTHHMLPRPARAGASGNLAGAEAGEVRHLREFSRFLVPRGGLFRVDMWQAIVAVLAGLVPALLIALSVIGMLVLSWLTLTFAYAWNNPVAGVAVAVAVFLGVSTACEAWWRAAQSQPPSASARGAYLVTTAAAMVAVGAIQWTLASQYAARIAGALPIWATDANGARHWLPALGATAYERWWHVAGIAAERGQLFVSPRLFDFAVTWASAAGVLLLVRIACAVSARPWPRDVLAAFDRVVMRLLGPAAVWSAVTVIWHVGVSFGWVWGMVIPTLLSGSAFAATRNLMFDRGKEASGVSRTSRIARYAPQVLAYVTVLLATAGVASALITVNGLDWLAWYNTALLGGLILTVGLLIDPNQFGLHAFYRDRLGRAYLGARREKNAADNRGVEMHDSDDVLMRDLPMRPLHLVCCAANDLAGDAIETLSRGARSATLSRHGFTIAGDHVPTEGLKLGDAITASAAAFNSNMGAVSKRLGPVVGFLLTALNLRLGLWVRHPLASPSPVRRWPGVLFYREMCGLTTSSAYRFHGAARAPLTPLQRDVHLSDGGHFENLGLYELIRRHCRYIIVSDCGADPDVAFDDLGNAFRRIREDFGVDIDIDIDPLRPNTEGLSQQHVALGSINYSAVDRGVLIYIKPSITGDEPPDVLQYRTRNTAFPHESTGDQFYDEAQWESYRRLGQHVATHVFAFMRELDNPDPGRLTADWVFAGARQAWYPTPPGLAEQVLAMTARFGQIEQELRKEPESGLLREVFPELEWLGLTRKLGAQAFGAPVPPSATTDLAVMLRATQVMEDVWTACQLERHSSHPLNLGWVNLFARWTSAPTFRLWWPVLAPMYTPGFGLFLEQRFALNGRKALQPRVQRLNEEPTGLAARWWRERSAQPRRWAGNGRNVALYALQVPVDRPNVEPLELGLTAVSSCNGMAGWTSEDFFVPPSLWGAGFGGQMLAGVLDALADTHAECYVCVHAPKAGADNLVARTDQRGFVEQYRKFHFHQLADGAGIEDDLKKQLKALHIVVSQGDTLLRLDFRAWARYRS